MIFLAKQLFQLSPSKMYTCSKDMPNISLKTKDSPRNAKDMPHDVLIVIIMCIVGLEKKARYEWEAWKCL